MPFVGSDAKLLFIQATFLIIFPSEVWTGLACLSNPCFHGVCIDNYNSTYFCYCIDGYTGIQCQTNWDECWSSPCKNGGVCVDGIASFNCSCPPGFVGELCEEDFNECESNPCLNNGTCLDATNGYTCSCWPGFSGIHCEIDVAVCNATNETRCANGGICVEGPGDTFTCNCQPGWEGFLCDVDIDECSPSPCQNGGVCIDLIADYTCACAFGYAARNCEDPVQICEINTCSNGALCLKEDGEDVCYCVPDFHGELCQFQYDECQIGRNECKNGGTCIDGIDNTTCVCPPSLTGIHCECLILDDDELDCTYIRPTTPEFTSSSTPTSTVTSTTTSTTTTTEEPTTTETSTMSSTEISTSEITSTVEILPPVTISEDNQTDLVTTTEGSTSTIMTAVPTSEVIPSEITTEEPRTIFPVTETTSEPNITEVPVTSTNVVIWTDSSSKESTISSEGTTYSTIPPTETTTEVTFTSQFSTSEIISSSSPKERESNSTLSFSTIIEEDNKTTPYYSSSSISPFFTQEPEVTTLDLSHQTDSSEAETTTLSSFDCSRSTDLCQNGGTCTYTIESGYKCVCPFDTEGHFCQIQLGVKKAAFVGNSYLSHRLSQGPSNITIEFNAKTLASEGLWFYSYVDEAYMALYTENGYLKFKFSCGYQTMLLSELKVPVNTGFLTKVKAILELSGDLRHCDASIRVNESLAMAGDQIAILNKFSRPSAWLHLGGVPEDFANTNLPNTGFVGCIMNLKIASKKVDIFKDADDGFGVTECSSLACLSNPCRNGASCHSKGEEWSCNCKTGFLGEMCEVSVCENNPCLFGGTCIPFSGSGYICLCPFGKHGHFCENDLRVTEPNFSSTIRGLSSYVAYPIPGGFSESMEIQFKFSPSTMDQISILLFIGQRGHHDFYSDHIAVSFVKGYIMLTWNLGSGPRRIFTSQPIAPGEDHYSVRLGRTGRRAWLFVQNLGNVTGRSPGYLVHLDVLPILYLGGHDSQNFSILPHDLPLHTGFSGCIFDVKLVSDNVVIPLQGSRQTTGRAVGQCKTTECYEQSCQNNGACLHHGSTFMCLCQDNWFGPVCTSRRNPCDFSHHNCSQGSTCVPIISDYECDCPPGKKGRFCENSEDITDVGFSGKRSFLTINSGEFENNHFNIEFELRALKDNGLVLFFGRKSSGFLSLSLENGVLDLKISPSENRLGGNDPTTIPSSKILVKGVWYKIQLGVFGKKAYLSVDNVISSRILSSERGITLSKEDIFIGGLPDLSSLPQTAISFLSVSFKGCIRRNINDCDGTPCGKDACLNGGSCWLDSFLKPHCSCTVPYYGNKCELIPDCHEEICKNTGKCSGSKCFCKVGFSGAFCENEIRVTTPEFSGKSYLLVKNEKIKRNARENLNLKNLYLNFTTVKKDALLIWSKKSNHFVGIGLEKGFLKIVYSDHFNKTSIDVPSYYHISDGLWHTLEISFTPFLVKLDQNKLPNKGTFRKSLENATIPINGFLYIGGVPTQSTIWKETNGIFSESFEGCIEGFGVNEGRIIRDFTNFDGVDVDICSIF